jgi:hypothetical protein
MAMLSEDHVVPSDEVLRRIAAAFGPLEAVAGPARGNGRPRITASPALRARSA